MQPYYRPCHAAPWLWDDREPGEDHAAWLARIDEARLKCLYQCTRLVECRQEAKEETITGVVAGELYDEGKRLDWPQPENPQARSGSKICACGVAFFGRREILSCLQCRDRARRAAKKPMGVMPSDPRDSDGCRDRSCAA